MTTVAKSTPVGALGFKPGDHLVRFHVGEDTVSFEIAASGQTKSAPRHSPGFLSKWGGTARRMDDPADVRLTHINEKHLR